MGKIAVFVDIDNTIIDGTTLKILVQYFFLRGKIKISFFTRLLIWYFQYKRNKLKEFTKILMHAAALTESWNVAETEKMMQECFNEKIKPRIYKGMLEILQKHHQQGHEIYFVSSTIRPVADMLIKEIGFGIPVVTETESKNGYYTGEIIGDVCFGVEKIRRIKVLHKTEMFDLQNSYAYTDHPSDIPLLQLVGHAVVVNPKEKLENIARERGWEILELKENVGK